MAFELLLRSARSPIERLISALLEPARRDRTLVAVLVAYTALWTLYGVIADSSRDIHFDMAEMVAWSREFDFGTPKHPPLGSWLVRAWFSVFPLTDWSYYLLAMTMASSAMWFAWQVLGRFLDGEKRVLGLALLTLIPFFNVHALRFNANSVLLPLWAATIWFFLRSFETRRVLHAALAGFAAAAAMLGKYWSFFLLAGLALGAITDPRRSVYFRSWAPLVTIGVGAFLLVPHAAWLIVYDFPTVSQAYTHSADSAAITIWSAFSYIASAMGFVALAVVVTIAVTRPSRKAALDIMRAPTADRRFAVIAFWTPLLLPIVFAIAGGFKMHGMWTMPAWTLLPVVLLSSPLISVSRLALQAAVGIAVAVPLVMVAAAPLVSIVTHRTMPEPAHAHGSLLVAPVERVWQDTTDKPLRVVGGNRGLPNTLAFYLPSRPLAINGVAPFPKRDVDEARIVQSGIAFVCRAYDQGCVSAIEARAARGPAGRRVEVEIARWHFGVEGQPERYVIITIPPQTD